MKNKCIYIPDNDLFFTINPDDVFQKISIDEVNEIALVATTLKPVPAVTEILGYVNALENHFEETNDKRSEFLEKLTSNFYGGEFLCTTIALYLLEKQMRENGINDELIERYNVQINKYQDIINTLTIEENKKVNNNIKNR